jgi:hypothetical protein
MNPDKYSWHSWPQETMDKKVASIAGAGWTIAEKESGE